MKKQLSYFIFLSLLFFFHLKESKAQETLTFVNEVDSVLQKKYKKEGKRLLQIYLIRHAKPDVKRKILYSAEEAQTYLDNYNSFPIIPFSKESVKVNLYKKHIIYCSFLPRSQETALAIFGDHFPIVADSVFNEYPNKIISAKSIVKLPLDLWLGFSRASWLLGWNHKRIESKKEAKKRSKYAANNLVKVAHLEETAILVAHGMLNIAIKKELKNQGWTVLEQKGHINLGATILSKVIALD